MASPEAFPENYPQLYKTRFQPIPGYIDHDRLPSIVACQTHKLLDLYHVGGIIKPEPAQEYLHDYTLNMLNNAASGADRLFNPKRPTQIIFDSENLEHAEAADFTLVVLAWMRELTTSQFFPVGFSKRGILAAPDSIRKFLERISELKTEIGLIVSGIRQPGELLELRGSRLRTDAFFKTGSDLAHRLPISSAEKLEHAAHQRRETEHQRSTIDFLLGDMQIDLP